MELGYHPTHRGPMDWAKKTIIVPELFYMTGVSDDMKENRRHVANSNQLKFETELLEVATRVITKQFSPGLEMLASNCLNRPITVKIRVSLAHSIILVCQFKHCLPHISSPGLVGRIIIPGTGSAIWPSSPNRDVPSNWWRKSRRRPNSSSSPFL